MSTPQSEEYLAARRESCKLLRLDPDDLSPFEAIRADVLTCLRLWLDGGQGQLLAGGNVDPAKLLAVSEALAKLVPEPEHRGRREDPRQIMWETYLEMRKRGELGERAAEPTLREQLAKLQAENAQLKGEIEALRANGEPAPVESAPPAAPAAPAGNVVPLKPPAAAAPAPAAPQPQAPAYELGDPEPWRPFIGSDGSIMSRPGQKYWGPV